MKKFKMCEHCDKRFNNRENLINHLMTFHDIDIFVHTKRKKSREDKPLRKIRMMMCQARRKKERDLVSRKAISRGPR